MPIKIFTADFSPPWDSSISTLQTKVNKFIRKYPENSIKLEWLQSLASSSLMGDGQIGEIAAGTYVSGRLTCIVTYSKKRPMVKP